MPDSVDSPAPLRMATLTRRYQAKLALASRLSCTVCVTHSCCLTAAGAAAIGRAGAWLVPVR